MIEQAYFYAHHREIDCSLFGVSNGWWTNLYARDAEDPMQAMVSIFHRDLPTRFIELYSKIGATQVTFEAKRRILRRMEQVLAADVDLERMDEFIQAAQGIAAKARPLVLENYRKNAKVKESTLSRELLSYLENSRPYDIIQTLMMANLPMGHMHTVVQVVSRKVAESAGGNHFLFFHRLVVADTRAVTTPYYTSALLLLMVLYRNPDLAKIDYPLSDGKRSGELKPLFFDFVRMILYHFESRPDLRVIWAMEGLLTRMISRTLVSNETSRTDITAGVAGARYLLPESEIAVTAQPTPFGAIR